MIDPKALKHILSTVRLPTCAFSVLCAFSVPRAYMLPVQVLDRPGHFQNHGKEAERQVLYQLNQSFSTLLGKK
jgi:hypothetical protein